MWSGSQYCGSWVLTWSGGMIQPIRDNTLNKKSWSFRGVEYWLGHCPGTPVLQPQSLLLSPYLRYQQGQREKRKKIFFPSSSPVSHQCLLLAKWLEFNWRRNLGNFCKSQSSFSLCLKHTLRTDRQTVRQSIETAAGTAWNSLLSWS